MREIKFRFWDKRDNEFRYDLLVGNDDVYDVEIGCCCPMVEPASDRPASKSIVVQQYTGLKDKNGVDIYEGDVILWEEGHAHPEMDGEIKWVENGYYFLVPEHNVGWMVTKKSLQSAKIIGNIFEGVKQ